MSCGKNHKKKRLRLNKAGPISIADFKTSLGPTSSTVFLTQVGMPKEKKRKKKRKKDSLFPDLKMVKSANRTIDMILDALGRDSE